MQSHGRVHTDQKIRAVRRRVGRRMRSTGFLTSRSFPMSSTPLATALVVPFEQLRMTDVEAVGGKNACLGEMISQLAASRRARARRLCHHGACLPRSSCATAAWRERIQARLATLDTDDVRALAEAGAEIRRWIVDTPFPPRPARRRSARSSPSWRATTPAPSSPCARRPPPKTCPTPRSPASRRPSSTCVGIDDVLHTMKEVFASLYNDRAISYRVHKGFAARRRGAVGRRAAHGALRPRRRPA